MEVLKEVLLSDWRNTIEEAIALAAIILAWVHAIGLRKQLKQLEEVRLSLPTQHLGTFPEFIDDIAKLVDSARRTVDIFCDYPAYGVFSHLEGFRAYTHALEKPRGKDFQINLVCLDTTLRRAKAGQDFAKGTWSTWLAVPSHLKRVEKFLARHRSETDPHTVTREELLALFAKEDERVLADTFAAPAAIIYLSVSVPLYFWLVDGNRAIFAIPSFQDRSIEHGYSTQDPYLIEGLIAIRDRYVSESRNTLPAVASD